MQLAPGSTADQWFDESILSCSSFAHLHREFMLRWPPPKTTTVLPSATEGTSDGTDVEEEDIGVWYQGNLQATMDNVIWANKVMRIAMGMGDSTGLLVEYTIEGIPNILHLFMRIVARIPSRRGECTSGQTKESQGRPEHEPHARRQHCTVEGSELISAQYYSLPIFTLIHGQWPPAQPYVRASHAYTNTIPFLTTPPNANPNAIISQGASMAPISRPVRGAGMTPMGWRGNPIMRTAFTRAQIMEKLNAVLQRQNTEAGLTVRHDQNPPAPRVKVAPARSSNVTTGSSRADNDPTYTIAHATQAVHPYYQQYGAPMTPPVFAVQEEQNWWEHSNVWAQQEAGYEWEPENYGGPLPTVEQ
ncbi:hypothetical protein DFJ58DRAFT_738566 [Suillus subalutaceus]|uniref:uncharacterized protein n=1 Tax=Suillus subalutaceus TaxID=48586 RepID=UPI001B85DDF4|nr:uncharacterized protein DFJ58DRAFT_738566 [Suillus subalutaceus]KAG1825229.1 hypothetical protein DFJ58DRAFT_738566 [Suillus subalutaceus]